MSRACRGARAPDANVLVLDPDGHDVSDPIGGGEETYEEACTQIEAAVEARLPEIVEMAGLDRS